MGFSRSSIFKLSIADLSDTTTVAHAPTTILVSLTPEAGSVYEVINISAKIPAPVGAAAGTHSLTLYQTGVATSDMEASALFGAAIYFRLGNMEGNDHEYPSNAALQEHMIHRTFYASATHPLHFLYKNSSDVDQTGNREIYVTVKKYSEGA